MSKYKLEQPLDPHKGKVKYPAYTFDLEFFD